jgi:hypothetical protein
MILFPDKVKITPVETDTSYRTETDGTVKIVKASVEESGGIKFSAMTGQPLDPEIWIFFPKGTTIKQGDYIERVKLHGATPTAEEALKRKVRKVHRAGGFTISHIEALV